MMNRLRKDLEVLKSWGIESISVDKVLSMIDEVDEDKNEIAGEDCARTFYPLCKEEIRLDVLFKEIANAIITASPVGGTIFYIDDTSDGVYEFFDASGNPIKNVQIGDRPCYYRIIKKGSKDKYYVYHDEIYNHVVWTYCDGGVHMYEALGTYNAIGSGKTNTSLVMAKDNGVYIAENSNGYPTIWYQLQQVRNDKVGGCRDWFVPTYKEIEELRKAIKSGAIIGGTIAGSSYEESLFSNKCIWSSGEYSSQNAGLWNYHYQNWGSGSKHGTLSAFFVRSF